MCRAKGDGKSTESSRSFLGGYNQKRTSVITIMEPVCSKQVSGLRVCRHLIGQVRVQNVIRTGF